MSGLEFSRPFALQRLGEGRRTEHLVAAPDERAALARRFGLLSLDRLESELTLQKQAAGTLLHVAGWLEAEVVQPCVVTLEPVRASLREEVDLTFTLVAPEEGDEIAVDIEGPEPLPEGGLDLGEEVAQLLSLALDPYPRAPGAALPEEASEPATGPFADLKRLRPDG